MKHRFLSLLFLILSPTMVFADSEKSLRWMKNNEQEMFWRYTQASSRQQSHKRWQEYQKVKDDIAHCRVEQELSLPAVHCLALAQQFPHPTLVSQWEQDCQGVDHAEASLTQVQQILKVVPKDTLCHQSLQKLKKLLIYKDKS